MKTMFLINLFAEDPYPNGFSYDYLANNHMNQVGARNFLMLAILVFVVCGAVFMIANRIISTNDARRNADALNVLKSNEVALKKDEVSIKASSQDLDAFMAFQKNPELYTSFVEFKACNGDPKKLAALAAKTSQQSQPQSKQRAVADEVEQGLFNESDGLSELLSQAAEMDDQGYPQNYGAEFDENQLQQQLFEQQQVQDSDTMM